MGYLYYKEAAEFKERLLNEYGLGNLKSSDAVDINVVDKLTEIVDENGNVVYNFMNSNDKILDFSE